MMPISSSFSLFFCLHSVGGCCEILEIENYEQVGPLLQWLTSCLQSRPFTFDHRQLALNESFPLKSRQVHIHDFTWFFSSCTSLLHVLS